MNKKKAMLFLSTITAAAAPIASVVSCGSSNNKDTHKLYVWTHSDLKVNEAQGANTTFDVAKLKSHVSAQIQKDIEAGFPGATLSIWKDGNFVDFGNTAFGYAQKVFDDPATGKPKVDSTGHAVQAPKEQWRKMKADTMFDLASNTKMYSANLLAMRFAAKGWLDVNAPVKTYIPQFTGDQGLNRVTGAQEQMHAPDGTVLNRDDITVKDLLSHTGGFAPEELFFNKNHLVNGQPAITGDATTTPQEFYSIDAFKTKELLMTKIPLVRKKTGKHVYSDSDFMMMGLIIEFIYNKHNGNVAWSKTHHDDGTWKQLDQIAHEEIYKPMGLTKTMFTPLEHKAWRTDSSGNVLNPTVNDIAATAFQGNTRDSILNTHYPTNLYGDGNNKEAAGGQQLSDRNTWGDRKKMRRGVIVGEVHDEKSFYTMGGVSGHAGLFSTAKEINKLETLLLNKGKYTEGSVNYNLFDGIAKQSGETDDQAAKRIIDEFTTPPGTVGSGNYNPTYGIGWRTNRPDADGKTATYPYFSKHASKMAIGHTGWTGTIAIIDPTYNLAMVLLTNKKHTKTHKAGTGGHKSIWFDGDYGYGTGHYIDVMQAIYESLITK